MLGVRVWSRYSQKCECPRPQETTTPPPAKRGRGGEDGHDRTLPRQRPGGRRLVRGRRRHLRCDAGGRGRQRVRAPARPTTSQDVHLVQVKAGTHYLSGVVPEQVVALTMPADVSREVWRFPGKCRTPPSSGCERRQ